MYDFDKNVNRVNTNCKKWDVMFEQYGRTDLLPMWIADMDFEILPQIVEAVRTRAEHPVYGYTAPSKQCYDNIIHWNKKRNNYNMTKENIIFMPGVVPTIKAAIHAFTDLGDKILIMTPVYPPFHAKVETSGRQLVKSPLLFNGTDYEIDFDDFEKKIKSGVKIFILCNPHNPVGRVWTVDELQKIIDICYANHVIIFSDEIHSDIIFHNYKHNVLFTVSEKAKEIGIVCSAPSKTFNIAGVSASFAVVENANLRTKLMQTISSTGAESINLFGLTAMEAAYGNGEAWVDEMTDYVEKNAEFVCDYIHEHMNKIKCFKPQGTYLMWLDFNAFGLSQSELISKLIEDASVVLNDGITFGQDEGKGFVRLNIGCSKSLLTEGLDRIAKVFGNN